MSAEPHDDAEEPAVRTIAFTRYDAPSITAASWACCNAATHVPGCPEWTPRPPFPGLRPRLTTFEERTATLRALVTLGFMADEKRRQREFADRLFNSDGMPWQPSIEREPDQQGTGPLDGITVRRAVADHEDVEALRTGFDRNAYTFLMSRSEAIAYGLAEPTDEERAALAAEAEATRGAREEAAARAREDAVALIGHLAEPTRPALRAVIDLHAPHRSEWTSWLTCRGCPGGDEYVEWPCPTVEAIAEVCGWPCPSPFSIPVDVISVSDVDGIE